MTPPLFGLKPVFKAALTSCTVMATGDVLCQAIRCKTADKPISINHRQTQRFALIGLTLHGPYFYHAFRWLDRLLPSHGAAVTLRQAMYKTAIGQVSVFPLYVASFYSYMGILEGLSPPQCVEKVSKAFVPTLVTGTAFWPFVNVINFLYVPAIKRVAFVNAAGLFWNAFLSYENSTKARIDK